MTSLRLLWDSPLRSDADGGELGRLHVDLDPEVDVALFLQPQQPDLSAEKFAAVGERQRVVEGNKLVIVGSGGQKNSAFLVDTLFSC